MQNKKTRATKRKLSQYRQVYFMLQEFDNELAEIDDRLVHIKGCQTNGLPRGGTPVTIADILSDKMELEERKRKMLIVAQQKKEIVTAYIDTVFSVKHNKFLSLYYLKCLSIRAIAKKESYSERHAFRVFEESVEKVNMDIDL